MVEMDILSGMLGPANLSIAMMDEPDEVRRRAMDAADFLRDMIGYEVSLHRSAGMIEGVTDCFGIWLEGTGVRGSEDFSALVGLEHFRNFFVAPLSRVYTRRSKNGAKKHAYCKMQIVNCKLICTLIIISIYNLIFAIYHLYILKGGCH
jgi:hypothetical protein